MFKRIIFFVALLGSVLPAAGQGSGRAASFNGSSYIDLDTAFISLNLPITITFWIKAPGNLLHFPFSSNYDISAYSGIRCRFSQTGNATFHYGDGDGFSQYDRRTLVSNNPILYNEWVHVAYIVSGPTNMAYYVNGIQVSGTYSGTGGPMYQPSGKSHFGRGMMTTSMWGYLNGELDDFTIWDKALSATEIRDLVCRNTLASSNQLLGYFDFDNPTTTTVTDLAYGYVGSFGGNMSTPISGASIGDTSYYAYPAPPTMSQSLSIGEQVVIKNFSGGTAGVQLYEVFAAPNSLNGLPAGFTPFGYFGVFLARTDNNAATYQLDVSNYSGTTQVFQRDANDDMTWSLVTPVSINGNTATFSSTSHTSEYVVFRQQYCRVDLGLPVSTCYPVSVWLKDQHYHPSKSYSWSTGATADSLWVTAPGTYFVQMDSAGCIAHDTIEVTAQHVRVELGPDQTICFGDSVWIKDLHYSPSKSYVWNGLQTLDSIKIGSTQLLIVEVDSFGCLDSDSLQLTVKQYPPPVFNTTLEKCIESPKAFTFPQGDYSFLWPDGSTANSVLIDTQSVQPFMTISPCNDTTIHTLLITQNICDSPCHIFVPNSFTPNEDGVNDSFKLGVSCKTTAFSFKVFNRWGTMIYDSSDPYFEWDGSYNGRTLSDGVYTYVMEYTSSSVGQKMDVGMIHLMK